MTCTVTDEQGFTYKPTGQFRKPLDREAYWNNETKRVNVYIAPSGFVARDHPFTDMAVILERAPRTYEVRVRLTEAEFEAYAKDPICIGVRNGGHLINDAINAERFSFREET